MALGPDSVVVNGQLLTQPQAYQFNPPSFGPQTIGVPNVSPSYPPFQSSVMGVTSPGNANVGGYGTADNNSVMTSVANANPWNWRVSPLPWAIAALVVGLAGLHFIHWREVVESHQGPFKEEVATEG